MRLIVTRPGEDAEPLCRKLEALGHEVVIAPMMRIVPREGIAIPLALYQLAVATSANGIRSLADKTRLKTIRLLTIGPQSLAAAKEAGLAHAEAHGGDVKGLASHIVSNFSPKDGPILYLSGAETAGDLAGSLAEHGFDCRRLVLYDAVPAIDLDAAEAELRSASVDGVLLYSPRTARIWWSLVEKAGLQAEASGINHICLSANVAAALPANIPRFVAERPDESAMLARLEQWDRTG